MGEPGGELLAGLFCHDLESLVEQCCSVACAWARLVMRVTIGIGSSREVPSGIAEGRVDVDSGDAEGRLTVIW